MLRAYYPQVYTVRLSDRTDGSRQRCQGVDRCQPAPRLTRVFIQCKKYKTIIVVNRDAGLAIDLVKGVQKAIDVTYGFETNMEQKTSDVSGITGAYNLFKIASYIPRDLIKGRDNSNNLWRLNNGPQMYEYQSLGTVVSKLHYVYLIENILAHYNGNYNVFSNNCQQFATEVCKLFGVEENILFQEDASAGSLWSRYTTDVQWRYDQFTMPDGDDEWGDCPVDSKFVVKSTVQ